MRLLELMVLGIPLLLVHLLGENSTPFVCLFPSLAAFTHSLNSYLNLNCCLSSVYGSMFSRTTCPQCSTWQHIGKVCCSHILGAGGESLSLYLGRDGRIFACDWSADGQRGSTCNKLLPVLTHHFHPIAAISLSIQGHVRP